MLRNKYSPVVPPGMASLEEKLAICVLSIRTLKQKRYPSKRTQMQYVSSFWCLFASAVARYFSNPENWYSQQFSIFIITCFLNGISHYVLTRNRSDESLDYAFQNFIKEDKNFFTHLTKKKANQKIDELKKLITSEEFILSVNKESRNVAWLQIFSSIISSAFEVFPANFSIFLLVKNCILNCLRSWFGDHITGFRLSQINSYLIDKEQKETLSNIEYFLEVIFTDLDIKKNLWDSNDEKNFSEEKSDQFMAVDVYKSRKSFKKNPRLDIISSFIYMMEISIMTISFSKKTKIVDYSKRVSKWDYLIDILARHLNKEFSNVILEVFPNTLKIAILPISVKAQPLLDDFCQEIKIKMKNSADLIQCAYEHCQALNEITSILFLSSWYLDFRIDKYDSLQITLLYNIKNLNESEVTELVEGLKEAEYRIKKDKQQLVVNFPEKIPSLDKLKKCLIALNLKKYENEKLFKYKYQKEKYTEEKNLSSIYFPLSSEDKTCSLVRSIWGFTSRVSRYTSSLWWNTSAFLTPKKSAPVTFNFGSHGQYIESVTAEQKIINLDKINKTAIRRLKNVNKIWTNKFVVVTNQVIEQIAKESPEIQKDIWEHIVKAQIVPHTDNAHHQTSGFVRTKETLKKGHSPIYIKLLTDKTECRLYALTAFSYLQADGKESVLYELDKFKRLHGKTVATDRLPKPQASASLVGGPRA